LNLHRNAALSLVKRHELVQCLDSGMPACEAAQRFGVHPTTVRRWRIRSRELPGADLVDRSSRPRRIPRATQEPLRQRVVELRRRRLTLCDIAGKTGLSIATVSRILAREGLSRIRYLDPPEPDNRYEHPDPGDMLHIDIKKVASFDRPGHRVTANPSVNSKGAGYKALFVAVDDHSRVAFCGLYPDERKESAAHFIREVLLSMEKTGAPVKAILTDNGRVFRSDLVREVYREHGCRHRTTRPYRPRTNGKAERFIQTVMREWAYRKPYRNSDERDRQLQPYMQWYNTRRPHMAIQGRPPVSRLPNLMKNDI